ncbi:MAG TPA: 2OG-Fe dioxygenase family protein [Rhodopila sp.]|uniref:2OG-Fe dioxygenase family protein n=1 Tax=Rhodopila sp. TaxID=2480087 RepID=UPI002BBE472D|nr:2OG-Fe dioxygenase family protein [Rhodopila sp.]HVY18205.1 2OG-Fe dioxygenase family protein [Rhodopila sp.]
MSGLARLNEAIRTEGYSFVDSRDMRSVLHGFGALTDWTAFAASWDDLGPDTYMADGGRYRKRRHAVYRAEGDAILRQPAQPHYQSRDYNPLNGGIERWFEPVLDTVGAGPSMRAILRFCQALFEMVDGCPRAWHVEIHQFRIEARREEAGRPTPEGMHRDGVDYVLVLLVNRENIASGVTSVHDLSGRELGSFTLTHPLDAALVDDRRVMHGVTPVQPLDASAPGHRDVLVVTFRKG